MLLRKLDFARMLVATGSQRRGARTSTRNIDRGVTRDIYTRVNDADHPVFDHAEQLTVALHLRPRGRITARCFQRCPFANRSIKSVLTISIP
jgi:hypothetical protein